MSVETVKYGIMEELVTLKFDDSALRAMLLATGKAELIEGDTWRDTTLACVKDKNGS